MKSKRACLSLHTSLLFSVGESVQIGSHLCDKPFFLNNYNLFLGAFTMHLCPANSRHIGTKNRTVTDNTKKTIKLNYFIVIDN